MSKACFKHPAASHTEPGCPMCNPTNLVERSAGFYDGQSWEQKRIVELLEDSLVAFCPCLLCRRTKELIKKIKGEESK